jgi:hypothetical protein
VPRRARACAAGAKTQRRAPRAGMILLSSIYSMHPHGILY